MPVCSKTVKKFTFRTYKHSKLAVRHFRQNGYIFLQDTIARIGSHVQDGADHKTYRTYLNSTHNAIFYSNMDETVTVRESCA